MRITEISAVSGVLIFTVVHKPFHLDKFAVQKHLKKGPTGPVVIYTAQVQEFYPSMHWAEETRPGFDKLRSHLR